MLRQQGRLQNSVKYLRRSFLRTIFTKLLTKNLLRSFYEMPTVLENCFFYLENRHASFALFDTSVNIVLTFIDKDFLEVDM